MPHELTKKPKKIVFKCYLLLFYTTVNHFFIGLWPATKSGFYMTASDDQLSGWAKKKLQSTSQSQTSNEKRSWSLFGYLLLIWSSTAFESWWTHNIWQTCSTNQWDAPKTAMPVVNRMCPVLHDVTWSHVAQLMLRKLIELGYKSFASSTIFTLPLPNGLPLLQASRQLIVEKTLPQPEGGRKCFPRVCQFLKHGFLCYKNKWIYFLLAKMCWL